MSLATSYGTVAARAVKLMSVRSLQVEKHYFFGGGGGDALFILHFALYRCIRRVQRQEPLAINLAESHQGHLEPAWHTALPHGGRRQLVVGERRPRS